jgi:hypothetical protein
METVNFLRESSVNKICFLDIDGVLATRWSYKRVSSDIKNCKRRIPFDPLCVSMFNKFIEQSGCKIVMSSSWRTGRYEVDSETLKRENVLGEFLGSTPRLNKGRGDEIAMWLSENESSVSSFVILDDDVYDIKDIFPTRHVYLKLGMELGFEESHLNSALQIINRELTAEEKNAYIPQKV